LAELVIFDALGSTNDEVMARAVAGAADGLWVMARRQTAGRGRRQRPWISEEGNLFASGLVRLAPGDGPLPQLSLVAALAVHSALSPHAGNASLVLRWPNDVFLNDGKLAGLLLEGASSGPAGGQWVVAGVGINLRHAPEGTEKPATSLRAETGVELAPEDCLEALVSAFEVWRQRWRADGMGAIRQAWLDRCAGVGERISVRLDGESFTGQFVDLDETGGLVVRLDSGALRTVHVGDVFALPSNRVE